MKNIILTLVTISICSNGISQNCQADFTYNLNDWTGGPCSEIELISTSSGTAPLTYCWDWNSDNICDSGSSMMYLYSTWPTGCSINQTITLTITDSAGCIDQISKIIYTVDTIPPQITCPVDILYSCIDAVNPTSTGFAQVIDNCDPTPTINYQDDSLGIWPCDVQIGRTWTAIDVCGNTSSCVQEIILWDYSYPTILCPNDTIIYQPIDSFPLPQTYSNFLVYGGIAFDSCAIDTNTFSATENLISNLCHDTIIREFYIEDYCQNEEWCTQLVIFKDTSGPIILNCIDTNLTDSCNNSQLNVVLTPPIVIDNFGGPIILFNNYNGTNNASDFYPEGITSIIWTATDSCGNSSTCIQNIIVNCDSLCTSGGVSITGDLTVLGNMAATGTKCFLIPHPTDPTKSLAHSCVEAPQRLNIYSGVTNTDNKGFSEVKLPDYFTAINSNYRYQLTTIGKSLKAVAVWEELNEKGVFVIKSKKPNSKVSWEVTAERADKYARENPFIVERDNN